MDEKKPLKDWTLAECKEYCKSRGVKCQGCILSERLCGDCGFPIPQEWPIEE